MHMPLALTLSYLYVHWHCHDSKPSRYAAIMSFMNIWVWDGNNEDRFPQFQTDILLGWVKNEDREVRAMAFIAAILMVIRHGNKLPKSFTDKFEEWAEDEVLREEFIEVQKYFLTSITGLKMQKKLRDEVIDKMQREQMIIREKLGMEDDEEVRMEIAEEGQKRMMPYVQKINDLVKDGIDMNLNIFASLHGLDIFKTAANWFVDYDINHPKLEGLGEKKQLAYNLFAHAELCDLDKYALTSVVDKIVSADNAQQLTQQLNEKIPEAELEAHLKNERQRNAYRYAFQTLLRFFQFSPWKKEVANPFIMEPFLTDYSILAPMITDKFLLETSKLLIRNSFYNRPATYLRSWMQRNGETEEVLRLLAHCDKHNGDNAERLECLLKLEKTNPEDMRLKQEVGLCLINEKRYEEALQRFFHLEVTENYLHGSARAIAWCSLMTGNISRAQRYYHKLLEWDGGPSWEDLLNAGHCTWVNGDPIEASKLYSQYLAIQQDDLNAFDDDYATLIALGLSADDISLMRDTISV